jgi:hypothetical protein
MAGAAIAGMAIGAIAASAAQQNRYYYGGGYAQPVYYYPRHRRVYRQRTRWCIGNQALYDDWGDFIGYQRVRYAC